ncbi:MAG: ATP-binding protein [Anaerolineae bacterium]
MPKMKMSVAQRITLAFAFMVLLVLVASGSGLLLNASASQRLATAGSAIDQTDAVANLEIAWYQVVASTDYMLLTRQTTLIEGRLGEQLATFNERLTGMEGLHFGTTDAAVAQNDALITTLIQLGNDLNATANDLFALASSGSWTRAQALRATELSSFQRRFSEVLEQLQTNIHADVEAAIVRSSEVQAAAQRSWIFISLIAVVSGIGAAVMVARSIIRPVGRLVSAADAIQQGDLTQRVPVSGARELGVMANAFNNMTDRLSKSIKTLEHSVEELEISNSERERLITELREALLFKDQFLATMSHELRTPLNAILGYAALILDEEDLNEDNNYMVSRIEGNSKRLLNLINDVLNIARINANRVEIVARPVEVQAMVQSWYNDFKHQADDKGLRFDLEIDPAMPRTIVGDEERLTQITANLLHNAMKFTDEGFIALRVNHVPDKAEWTIAVADSGKGIPDTWQHLIFDEFRQVDSGSKRKYGGAGLGLSIVKKLCLLMGGSVSVSSKLDAGSTFTVTLPLKMEVLPEKATGTTAKIKEETQDVAQLTPA